MKIISVLLLISLLSLGTFNVYASPDGNHSDKRLGHITKKLDLNDQQQQQFREIMQTHMQKRKALREQNNNDIKAILTTEQQKKFDQLQQEKKARHEKRRAERMQNRNNSRAQIDNPK